MLFLKNPEHPSIRLKAERARVGQPDTEDYDACVRETVDELLAGKTTSRHPGMLLGKIQSGRTRAFLGIVALAFDKGYDVAVVLTKGTKTLGNQTVRRISTEFKSLRGDNALQVFDILKIPNLTRWELEEQKLVIVAKKEHNNMRRLIELIATTHPELRAKRVIIIDDEADFASIRFAKKKGTDEIGQGRIASQMDELRRELSRCSFLQVTATPYALYLQSDEYDPVPNSNLLFEPKRPAFTRLVPVHSAYVGGDHYFGDHDEDRPEYYLWHPVDQNELDALRKEDRRRFNNSRRHPASPSACRRAPAEALRHDCPRRDLAQRACVATSGDRCRSRQDEAGDNLSGSDCGPVD